MSGFAAYTFYVNRPDLLQRAVESFPDLSSCLTVVNNSGEKVKSRSSQFYNPPVPLTYTQSLNLILKDATTKKLDFIIHFHSDAYSENPNAVKELLEYARKVKAEGRKWGCLWTFYDILWCINPVAMNEIGGWDTQFTDYFTDQDCTRRLKLAGWETIDTGIQGIHHEGSATINSDPQLKFINGLTFPLRRQYYLWKWGGEPGREVFRTPFNK